jgi:hypothetical protein
MEGIEVYPLTWPASWKRTLAHRRKNSRYKVNFARARDEVVRSLALMGVRDYNVVISSNVPTRRDGLPLANMREPEDPGVACYWTSMVIDADKRGSTERRVIACDSWRTVRDNLRAVGLALEALRTLERTGASEILNRAFTGFAALPPAEDDWRNVLGLRGIAVTSSDIEERYRALAKDAHPDSGGSHDAMVRLNRAREAALAFLRIG